ncbi:MAG TPA: TonB-dependent receptor, partial [Saprospiraceae bacterium]|nr:TonB-dependent receptor [Saprospiraceae bacterium]
DDAKVNRFNGMFRNTFFGDRFEGQLNGQALFEKRKAGQINAENPYRIDQEISHFSLYGNLGYVDFEKEGQTAGSLYDLSRSTVNSSFGNQLYKATENRALVQMFYMHPFMDGRHLINTGPVFTASQAEEIYRQDTLDYKEWTAGVYLDYTFRNSTALDNAFTFTISQRLENVSGDEWMYVPRANIRYLFAKDWTLRGSIGRGFRFPRIYADQSALFATAKTWSVTHDQQLEKSWNTGINIVGKPYLWGKELNINTDAYLTWFDEQLVVDLDEDYGQVMIYPLSGKSRAFQTITTLSYPVVRYFNLKIGGKYTNTKTDYKSGYRQALMIPKWRGLASLDFESANKKWLWNLTSNFVGKMRLADKDQLPHELIHEHDGYSKTYVLLQSQLTFSHKEWEFYVGAENLLDKTQHEAIIDASNPYGAYFNAAEIYAPVSGIKPYAGIKWYLKTRS